MKKDISRRLIRQAFSGTEYSRYQLGISVDWRGIELESVMRGRIWILRRFLDQELFDRILVNVISDSLEFVNSRDAPVRKTFLPNRRSHPQFPASTERKSTFDELNGTLNRHSRINR